jgi:hypothetical protein
MILVIPFKSDVMTGLLDLVSNVKTIVGQRLANVEPPWFNLHKSVHIINQIWNRSRCIFAVNLQFGSPGFVLIFLV